MKLKEVENKTSFYETFSDLIFATMAIFVLLMVLFITQVNNQETEDIEQKLQETAAQLEQKQAELTEAIELEEKLELAKQSFDEYHVELVIAVDTTGSMQYELDQLLQTIRLVGVVLPGVANSAKVGVVAYRRDQNNRDQIRVHPLQTLRTTDQDNGASLRALRNFIGTLKAEPGPAPVEIAMDNALNMFSDPDEFTGHQTFMLLGDVGPYEDFNQDQRIDPENIQQEQAMIRQLGFWLDRSLTRNVLILFSGEEEVRLAEGEQKLKYETSRTFFKKLADVSGQPEAFSTSAADMIPLLIRAVTG